MIDETQALIARLEEHFERNKAGVPPRMWPSDDATVELLRDCLALLRAHQEERETLLKGSNDAESMGRSHTSTDSEGRALPDVQRDAGDGHRALRGDGVLLPQMPEDREAVTNSAAEKVKALEAQLAAKDAAYTKLLTFKELIDANLSRVKRWHPENGLAEWSPLEWAGAMAGEAGEACNAAKKLKRIDIGTANINHEPGRSLTDRQAACQQVAKEAADTVVYAVLLCAAVGEDLGAAVIDVFNRKSEEYGFPERIGLAALETAPPGTKET